MTQNEFYVRVWVEGGEIRFVNSNELPIKHDMVQIDGAIVYDLTVLGDYMLAGTVIAQLSFADGQLSTGALSVESIVQRTPPSI